ncbi:MAG TPA: hypothetical protein VFZ08_16880 [Terriglobia bacterium]|nr:hypothetical protein [Terriglobia bacterium]
MKSVFLSARGTTGKLFLVLFIFFFATVCAQSATVRGRLDRRDRNGQRYAAIYVPVTLYNQQKGRSRFAYSDVQGMYYLYNVPPDDYYLEVWTSKDHPVRYPIRVTDPTTDIPAILLP